MEIFVGSLPFKITEAKLKELFEAYGEVASVSLIVDKITRLKKGYGFVQMPDDEQAMTAIEQLNGKEIMGRTIVVSIAEEKDEEEEGKRHHPKAKSEQNSTASGKSGIPWWKRNKAKKKPATPDIVYGTPRAKKTYSKDGVTRKKAKNFKVGKRKKS